LFRYDLIRKSLLENETDKARLIALAGNKVKGIRRN